ncbi:MAG: flagellar basal body protein, partial [Gammaproteobacteria bacterium]|nr:flagellar basal body protein [Gammaproteobacteria bacterium]
MSLFNVFDVAGSALNAQTLRLNTTSSNLANANSASSSTDQTYKARQPVFATMMS